MVKPGLDFGVGVLVEVAVLVGVALGVFVVVRVGVGVLFFDPVGVEVLCGVDDIAGV